MRQAQTFVADATPPCGLLPTPGRPYNGSDSRDPSPGILRRLRPGGRHSHGGTEAGRQRAELTAARHSCPILSREGLYSWASNRYACRWARKVRLADFDPDYVGGVEDKPQAEKELHNNVTALAELGYRLYAEGKRSLLVVLQGMDTSGKDGTIRHAMRGFNPQSCQVTSFKQPSAEELAHDFLWRIGRAVPRRGFIGIFNRSHYEDVLVVRIHDLVSPGEVEKPLRADQRLRAAVGRGGTTIVKISCTSAGRNRRGGCNRGWTIPTNDGSSAAPT